jgi:hypothetical protein
MSDSCDTNRLTEDRMGAVYDLINISGRKKILLVSVMPNADC